MGRPITGRPPADRFFPPRRPRPDADLGALLAGRAPPALDAARGFRKGRENTVVLRGAELQTLEAGGFRNDYYSHLLDCQDENVLGVVLHNRPWVLNRRERLKLELSLPRGDETLLSSLKFCRAARSAMAVGAGDGSVRVFDLQRGASSVYAPHTGRVGCLDWSPQSAAVLASGARDRSVCVSDTRLGGAGLLRLAAHAGEVCGLQWAGDGRELASGGNDNLVCVWDVRSPAAPRMRIDAHRAAVRGLCWAPFREGLLATGGGSGDMRILLHDTRRERLVREIVGDSQVCALAWEERSRALISGHGFSRYAICLWDLEGEGGVRELLGHTHRVLGLCLAGGTLFSAGADETLRVWDARRQLRAEQARGIAPAAMR